jgi:hypothetical protein
MVAFGCGQVEKPHDVPGDQVPGHQGPGIGVTGDEPASVETVLPEGGTAVQWAMAGQLTVDQSGVFWTASCGKVIATSAGESRRYDWFDSAIPERLYRIVVDAQNRIWFLGYDAPLVMLERGVWRELAVDGWSLAAIGADGSAWVQRIRFRADGDSDSVVQKVWPQTEPEIATPTGAILSLVASEPGVVWISTDRGNYRWADGAWSGPFAPDLLFLEYDPRQNVLWSDSGPVRLRWTGKTLEREPLVNNPSRFEGGAGRVIGFDERGRLVTAWEGEVRWFMQGELDDRIATGSPELPGVVLGGNGNVYLTSASEILALQDREFVPVERLARFDVRAEFPWRRAFASALRDAAADVTRGDLVAPTREVVGKNVRFVGSIRTSFESAALEVEGEVIPRTWVEAAREYGLFAAEKGLTPFGADTGIDPLLAPEQHLEPWELHGFLETGSCFGHLDGATRQFWLIEGYPLDLAPNARDALATELRERNPIP